MRCGAGLQPLLSEDLSVLLRLLVMLRPASSEVKGGVPGPLLGKLRHGVCW